MPPFGPENWELDRAWCGDITYVRTWEGWAYLATVIDLASRRVVGWAMADNMETSLVGDAMRMAIAARRPAPGLIFHADRGSQYTSAEFRRLLLADTTMIQSLSRPGQCWDNAVQNAGSRPTSRARRGRSWPTIAQLRSATFDYIEIFYNRQRRHSALGGISPANYEKTHQNAATQAA